MKVPRMRQRGPRSTARPDPTDLITLRTWLLANWTRAAKLCSESNPQRARLREETLWRARVDMVFYRRMFDAVDLLFVPGSDDRGIMLRTPMRGTMELPEFDPEDPLYLATARMLKDQEIL